MKKLVCDRCELELTEREDIFLALDGREAWEEAVRASGAKPRGVYPCENYMRCHGEMKLISNNAIARLYRWLRKSFSRQRSYYQGY